MRKRMTSAFVAAALALLLGVTAQANDEQIGQQIVQRLQQQRQAAQLEGFNIGVQVENGTVTMSGSVSGQPQATLALDVARRVPGVKLVINDLRVQSAANPAVTTVQPATYSATAPDLPAAATERVDAAPSLPVAAPLLPLAAPSLPVAPPTAVPLQASLPPKEVARSVPQANSLPAPPPRLPRAVTARPPQPLAFARGTVPAGRRPLPAHRGLVPAQYVQEYGGEYVGEPSGSYANGMGGMSPVPMSSTGGSVRGTPAYDNPQMPAYAWPSYAAHPNYAAVTYPHQYSPTAWPYIGPFYPYPQVPLGWRKVMLEWDDGWWYLDFLSK